MKRRVRHDGKVRPPPELAGSFHPPDWVSQAEMDEAELWDRQQPDHPGQSVCMTSKIQIDAFWRWMAKRDRWADEHGWTWDEMKAYDEEST